MAILKLSIYFGFIAWLIAIIAVILRYSERNRSQKVLASVLSAWILVFLLRVVSMIVDPEWMTALEKGVESLSFPMMVSGFFAFVMLCLYPVITIDPRIIRSRSAIVAVMPVLIAIASYIIYHKITGLPLNTRYTPMELWEARYSVTVIWRFAILLSFIATIIFSLSSIWHIIPNYDNYISKNYADTSHNVMWIRTFIIGCSCVSVVYFMVLLYNAPFTMVLYAIVAGSTFTIIMDDAIKHKSVGLPKEFKLEWDLKRGWHCICVDVKTANKISLTRQFYEWIEGEKPYLATDFSLNKVKEKFPDLTYTTLDDALHADGYTFQSYVRRCRIDEAIRLINSDERLNYKQIAYMVGFSHYSSFCRAFIAEQGVSPTHAHLQ